MRRRWRKLGRGERGTKERGCSNKRETKVYYKTTTNRGKR